MWDTFTPYNQDLWLIFHDKEENDWWASKVVGFIKVCEDYADPFIAPAYIGDCGSLEAAIAGFTGSNSHFHFSYIKPTQEIVMEIFSSDLSQSGITEYPILWGKIENLPKSRHKQPITTEGEN